MGTIQVPQQTMEAVQIQVPRMVEQETTVMVPQTTTEMVATQVPRTVVQEVETYTEVFQRPGRSYTIDQPAVQVGVVETIVEPTTYAAPVATTYAAPTTSYAAPTTYAAPVPTTYAAPMPTTYAAPMPTTYAAPTTYPAPVTPYGGSIIGTRY